MRDIIQNYVLEVYHKNSTDRFNKIQSCKNPSYIKGAMGSILSMGIVLCFLKLDPFWNKHFYCYLAVQHNSMIISFRIVRNSEFVLSFQRLGSKLTLAYFIPLPSQLVESLVSFALFLLIITSHIFQVCLLGIKLQQHSSTTLLLLILVLPHADDLLVSHTVGSVPVSSCTKH